MAQQVLVQLVDDLDGSSIEDVTTVQFSLDGAQYEIDLNGTNADLLRKAFAEYVSSARRTGGRIKRGLSSPGVTGRSDEAGLVRAWAVENGYELSGRGRIPSHVLDAYQEAQQPKQPKPHKPRAKRATSAKKA